MRVGPAIILTSVQRRPRSQRPPQAAGPSSHSAISPSGLANAQVRADERFPFSSFLFLSPLL